MTPPLAVIKLPVKLGSFPSSTSKVEPGASLRPFICSVLSLHLTLPYRFQVLRPKKALGVYVTCALSFWALGLRQKAHTSTSFSFLSTLSQIYKLTGGLLAMALMTRNGSLFTQATLLDPSDTSCDCRTCPSKQSGLCRHHLSHQSCAW